MPNSSYPPANLRRFFFPAKEITNKIANKMTATLKKVTSERLRDMAMGEELTFELPNSNAINSGKAIAYRLQHSLGCKFSAVSDYANNTLKIIKKPL